ncbi:MAG: HAD-IA family hydrolase [Sphingomonadales bacterium]|nr:HAD-IA family hydrolase [Sphingomonadales bacterium]MDE2568500.1 HAD-IA family hydrolase [Sphingomonadales bacterium]
MDWPKAIIFDVDGTLAETEEWHRQAFNAAFAAHRLDWHWDRALYRELLKVTGGKERIRHFAGPEAGGINVAAIHAMKNALYRKHIAEGPVELREGVRELIDFARGQDIRLAVATTTSRGNLTSLLDRAFGGSEWFETLVCGEDVRAKKPDPEAYTLALERMGLAAQDCLAVEDSRSGLEAAAAAGIACLLSPSDYCEVADTSAAWRVVGAFSDLPSARLLARETGEREICPY